VHTRTCGYACVCTLTCMFCAFAEFCGSRMSSYAAVLYAGLVSLGQYWYLNIKCLTLWNTQLNVIQEFFSKFIICKMCGLLVILCKIKHALCRHFLKIHKKVNKWVTNPSCDLCFWIKCRKLSSLDGSTI